jgi:hypothetical protein
VSRRPCAQEGDGHSRELAASGAGGCSREGGIRWREGSAGGAADLAGTRARRQGGEHAGKRGRARGALGGGGAQDPQEIAGFSPVAFDSFPCASVLDSTWFPIKEIVSWFCALSPL